MFGVLGKGAHTCELCALGVAGRDPSNTPACSPLAYTCLLLCSCQCTSVAHSVDLGLQARPRCRAEADLPIGLTLEQLCIARQVCAAKSWPASWHLSVVAEVSNSDSCASRGRYAQPRAGKPRGTCGWSRRGASCGMRIGYRPLPARCCTAWPATTRRRPMRGGGALAATSSPRETGCGLVPEMHSPLQP